MTHLGTDIIDAQTIKGCKTNNSICQRKLYELSVNKLYNVVQRIILDRHKTQDVLQESYIKIFDKINKYDVSKGSIYAWMCKICINCSINYLRSDRLVFEEVDSIITIADKEMSVLHKLEAEYILQLMETLPQQQRIIFNLYEIEGYSHDEIADLLAINVNSCRVYLSRAKSKLQELIIIQQNHYLSKTV